jgi:hypothetical protein
MLKSMVAVSSVSERFANATADIRSLKISPKVIVARNQRTLSQYPCFSLSSQHDYNGHKDQPYQEYYRTQYPRVRV